MILYNLQAITLFPPEKKKEKKKGETKQQALASGTVSAAFTSIMREMLTTQNTSINMF